MMAVRENFDYVLQEMPSQQGTTLAELSSASPVLLVFLRHLGCSFCRQTLSDLQSSRSALETVGVGVALVHMATDRDAEALFSRYGLADVPRFSDPDRRFYQVFGLRTGGYRNLWKPRVLVRGFQAAAEHGVGRPRGNPFQMPGVFLVDQGRVLAGTQLVTAADRPDYVSVVASHLSLGSSVERPGPVREASNPAPQAVFA